MATSKIEWTEHTWNPVTGCTRVSAGCDNCYAATMTKRLAAMGQEKYAGLINIGKGHFNGVIKLHPDELDKPLRRKKPTTYFVNSMSDLFHKKVPFPFVEQVFAVMALSPQHTFQVLTKRPDRMAEFMSHSMRMNFCAVAGVDDLGYSRARMNEAFARWPLPNVWLGTSVEDQDTADERVPHLLRCDAAVRFLSAEPLLGPVDVAHWLGDNYGSAFGGFGYGVGWVIVGGESGHGARPMHPEWVRSLRDQCELGNTAFFFKQWGAYLPYESYDVAHDDTMVQTIGLAESGALWRNYNVLDMQAHGITELIRLGKKESGREIDGRTWDEMPVELEAA